MARDRRRVRDVRYGRFTALPALAGLVLLSPAGGSPRKEVVQTQRSEQVVAVLKQQLAVCDEGLTLPDDRTFRG